MTTEDATYIIAHKEKLILDKYLSSEEIDRIRTIIRQLDNPLNVEPLRRHKILKKANKTENALEIHIAKEIIISDPILSQKKVSQAKEMASLYPLLYILENSIRELIEEKMHSLYGDSWWSSIAPKGLKDTVIKRMQEDQRNSWHQRRGAKPIDYLDLNQLVPLVRKIEDKLIPNILPSMEWFSQLVEEVYISRCVICHMNPLNIDNVQALKLKFKQWQKQIKAKIDLIK